MKTIYCAAISAIILFLGSGIAMPADADLAAVTITPDANENNYAVAIRAKFNAALGIIRTEPNAAESVPARQALNEILTDPNADKAFRKGALLNLVRLEIFAGRYARAEILLNKFSQLYNTRANDIAFVYVYQRWINIKQGQNVALNKAQLKAFLAQYPNSEFRHTIYDVLDLRGANVALLSLNNKRIQRAKDANDFAAIRLDAQQVIANDVGGERHREFTAQALCQLVRVEEKAERYSVARAYLAQIASLQGKSSDINDFVTVHRLGISIAEGNDIARQTLRRHYANNPDSKWRAYIMDMLGGARVDHSYRITDVDKAVAAVNTERLRLAFKYAEAQDYTNAITLFSIIADQNDAELSPPALFKVGDCYQAIGSKSLARQAYQHFISLYPNDSLVPLAQKRLGELQ